MKRPPALQRHIARFTCLLLLWIGLYTHAAQASTAGIQMEQPAHSGEYLFSLDTQRTPIEPLPQRAKPWIARSRLSTLNASKLWQPSGQPQKQLTLNLFGDTVINVLNQRLEKNASGSTTWLGKVQQIPHSLAIFIIREQHLLGKISLPDATYEITQLNNDQVVIRQLDTTQFQDHNEALPHISTQADALAAPLLNADDGSVIDVLVTYSNEALAGAGSVVNMESTIELAVAETNAAYAASGINQRIELVHMYAAGVAELSGFSNNLNALQAPNDGYIDEIHALRDEYHADFVQLIIEDSSACGLGYMQTQPNDANFESFAFAVTSRICTTGYYSFAHELGHNMGLRHDWYVDDNTTPYTWAHGLTNPPGNWRTIMAYNSFCSDQGTSCTRLAYFSNPNNSFNGSPMGVAAGTAANCTAGSSTPDPNSCDADNHAVLNSNATSNASFRQSKITWVGQSSDWALASNWIIEEGPVGNTTAVNRIPRSIDDVYIPATPAGGNFPIIAAGTFNVRHLIIEDGARLEMTGGQLNVYGSWEERGSGTFTASAGLVVFMGQADQSIQTNANSNFFDLDIGDGLSTQQVSLLSNIDVGADLRILTGASLQTNGFNLNIAGDWLQQGGDFIANTGTVNFYGNAQTLDKQAATPARFYNLTIASNTQLQALHDMAIDNALQIQANGILDLSTQNLTVENTLDNQGTLQQTQNVSVGNTTAFLRITNQAGTNTLYFGLDITPNSSDLGSTRVAITGQSEAGWVQRQYEILPTNTQAALVRFYYDSAEANGNVSPEVYQWNGSSWDNLGASNAGGSGNGLFVETSVTSYSRFALHDPTTASSTLDVDHNNQVEALTDAVLIMRRMMNFEGLALTDNAVGSGCQYCDSASIITYLTPLLVPHGLLDIDNNGQIDALTDGMLILRYLLGVTDLTPGAVGIGCTRCTESQIRTYLDTL